LVQYNKRPCSRRAFATEAGLAHHYYPIDLNETYNIIKKVSLQVLDSEIHMKNKFVQILLLLFSFWVSIKMIGSTYDIWKRRDILIDRQKDVIQIEKKNNELKRELEEVQNPNFLDKQARNVLGLVKPGESLVLLPSPQVYQKQSQNSPKDLQYFEKPSWKLWWELIR
jgi:cell division protein FtsB